MGKRPSTVSFFCEVMMIHAKLLAHLLADRAQKFSTTNKYYTRITAEFRDYIRQRLFVELTAYDNPQQHGWWHIRNMENSMGAAPTLDIKNHPLLNVCGIPSYYYAPSGFFGLVPDRVVFSTHTGMRIGRVIQEVYLAYNEHTYLDLSRQVENGSTLTDEMCLNAMYDYENGNHDYVIKLQK